MKARNVREHLQYNFRTDWCKCLIIQTVSQYPHIVYRYPVHVYMGGGVGWGGAVHVWDNGIIFETLKLKVVASTNDGLL